MSNISDQQHPAWQHSEPLQKNEGNSKKPIYVHRGYMGLASELYANARWNEILEVHQPDLHNKCKKIFEKNKSEYNEACCKALMSAMEYSPVLAAFGYHRSKNAPILEMDLWLDKEDPSNLDKAKFVHGNLLSLIVVRAGFKSSILTKPIFGSNVHNALSPSEWLNIF